jgi:glycosyltransferase involved in cell wall biosynthesis
MLKPCLLIPIYDHGDTIGDVVRALEPHGLPLLIVDDGSGEPTRREIDVLVDRQDWVELCRRPHNGGRGAALRDGYRELWRRGYTHALQLDADGQHDPADVPRMLAAARDRPEALVLGLPIFDDSAPALRLHARKLSQGLVWLETLSFAIRDPLCGFRCFPLAATVDLLERWPLGDHMEFDPELAVRLVWAGVPVVNVPTRVVYREGGLSHYVLVDDTLRIAGAHVRLVAGMLMRSPWLLAHRWAGSTPPSGEVRPGP